MWVSLFFNKLLCVLVSTVFSVQCCFNYPVMCVGFRVECSVQCCMCAVQCCVYCLVWCIMYSVVVVVVVVCRSLWSSPAPVAAREGGGEELDTRQNIQQPGLTRTGKYGYS